MAIALSICPLSNSCGDSLFTYFSLFYILSLYLPRRVFLQVLLRLVLLYLSLKTFYLVLVSNKYTTKALYTLEGFSRVVKSPL
jgi:hypothetical protein